MRRFKPPRLGPHLLRRAREPEFARQVHVIFGGTGAVGGATALQMLGLFEEALATAGAAGEERPRLVVTGRTHPEINQFTSLFFRLHQRDTGRRPQRLEGVGYRTASGVVLELATFSVDPSIPGLDDFARLDAAGREQAVARLLEGQGVPSGAGSEEKLAALERLLAERVGHPFTEFLEAHRERRGLAAAGRRPFRSVVVGIPLASIAAYRLPDVEAAAVLMGAERASARIEALKDRYLGTLRGDLGRARRELAEEVLVAHTTGVGGMYDEEEDGRRTFRMGFAHSALDRKLAEKQLFAEKLVRLYTEAGVKMLITAAAIGVDSVLVRHAAPMNPRIRRQLEEAQAAGALPIPESDLAQRLRVYAPRDLDLLDEPHERVRFEHGKPLLLDCLLRSGENGYFTISNADALYRVMRVTSASELGLLLARVAVLGEAEGRPFFEGGACYYAETDYSRQVLDLLGQGRLRRNQTSALQPKALQDLGSAKHQAELHTLGLLILDSRLESLDLERIPVSPDMRRFEPARFFEKNSRALTLERAAGLDPQALAARLRVLVTARKEQDLMPLKRFVQPDPDRQRAAHRVLQAALRAVWAVPSIGTPVLYEDSGGRRRVAAGSYAAALDCVVTHRDSFARHLRERFVALGGGGEEAFERFVEFHVANNGFADLRPLAVLVTARSDEEDLEGRVQVFRDEAAFVEALGGLEPYSYFTTSGLLALKVRLSGLYRLAGELDLTLGSANEFRVHLPRDHHDRALLVPGVVEAFRLVSEGLEKNTGLERLDGRWGYYLA